MNTAKPDTLYMPDLYIPYAVENPGDFLGLNQHERCADQLDASTATHIAPQAAEIDELEKSFMQRTRDVLGRHKGKLALAACGVSLALPFVLNPVDKAAEQVGSAIGWTVAGGAVSESMFCGGLAIMAGSVGVNLGKNPTKWKERMPEVCEKADNSLLFKAGFWVNTTGAIGTAVIGATAAVEYLPPSSWGVLALPAFDLGVTYYVRKMMLDGIKEHRAQNEQRIARLEA